MIEYLNQNQGAITALLTVVLIGINIAYCIINRSQVREMKTQWKKSQEPHITATIYGVNTFVYFKITNIGHEVATDLKLFIDDKIINCFSEFDPSGNRKKLHAFENHGIILLPGKTIYVPAYVKYSKIEEWTITLKCRYNSIGGDEFEQNYAIDLKMFGAFDDYDPRMQKYEQQLERIDQSLRSIAESLKHIYLSSSRDKS